MSQIKSSLIILTRNEISGLKSLINKIPFDLVDEYFAVDYDSTDGTVEFFKKHHIPVIRQKVPGRSEAFRIGAKNAKGKYLIYFSPDGNEDPGDIPRLIKLMDKKYDLAIATRFVKGARNEEDDQFFKFRAWANQFFTWTANIIWHGHLTDSINGYRAITKDAFKRLHLDAQGFAIEYQMSIRSLKLKLKIGEIPTKEGNRIGGQSGSAAIPTGLKFIYYLIREILISHKS